MDPEAAIDLIEALVSVEGTSIIWGFPTEYLRRIASFFPCRVFDLLRQYQSTHGQDFAAKMEWPKWYFNAEKLGAERICWALTNAPRYLPDDRAGRKWFCHLSKVDQRVVVDHYLISCKGSYGAFLFAYAPQGSARESAFLRWRAAACDDRGVIHSCKLDALPWDLRQGEARYHVFNLPYIQAEPSSWVPYTRLLPWDEAESVLRPYLGHPEGDVRSMALSALILVLRHDINSSSSVMAAVRRRKNEQDPVRCAMLNALAEVCRARIADNLVSEVVGVIEEALNAADLSWNSASHAIQLFPLILRWDPVVGATLLNRFIQVRGNVDIKVLANKLSKDEIRLLDPVLSGAINRWVRTEETHKVQHFIRGLGRHLRLLPATLNAIGAMCYLPDKSVVDVVLDSLVYDRDIFRSHVLELLSVDHSAVAIPAVVRFLVEERTDLLDPFLDGKCTHWILNLGGNLQGLNPSQQARYGASLCALIDDPERSTSTNRWAILSLASLPCLSGEEVVRYAHDSPPRVRDLAIRALSHLDGNVGLTALLDCMGDDRARVAIYALRKALAERSQSEIFDLLLSVPLDRVTVAKEVVRLLGEYGGISARDHIIELGAQQLHRDVFIALLRALWDHLDYPPAWALVEKGLSSDDPIIISRLIAIPRDKLSAESDKRMSSLFAAIIQYPVAETRVALLDSLYASPLRDVERTLLNALINHLGTSDPVEAAKTLDAILHGMTEEDVSLLVENLKHLLPRRPHIGHLIMRLLIRSKSQGNHCQKILRSIAPILLNDVITAELGLCALACVASTDEVGITLVSLAEKKMLHDDLMQTVIESKSRQSDDLWCGHKFILSLDSDMLSIHLQRVDDSRLRRIALAHLVMSSKNCGGWTAERRDRLKLFQSDPSTEVSAIAAWIFPPPE